MEVFAQDVTLGGCLSKYRRAFIVYMFRRPPEVWSLLSDNASISGTGKARMHSFFLFVLRNTNVHKICLSVWYSSLFCNMSDRILYGSVWSRLSVTATLKVSWLSAIYCWARLVALITGLGYLDGISRCSPIAFLYARGAMEHAHSIGTCNWGTLGFWLW